MRFSEFFHPKSPGKGKNNFNLTDIKQADFSTRDVVTTRFKAPTKPESVSFPRSQSFSATDIRNIQDRKITAIHTYSELVKLCESLLSGLIMDPIHLPDLDVICEVTEWVIDTMESEPSKLLELTDRSTLDSYLPGHTANVTILSIAVSQEMKWPKEVRRAIGVGSLFHDTGMVINRRSYSDQELYSDEKRKAMRKLPKESLEILKGFMDTLEDESRTIIENIIVQIQERISGNGYPNKLKGDEICKEAQLVGLCDTYESLTHSRPYRERKPPHETLRYMIELAGDLFDSKLVKKLWETLTLFPPGSFVELNNGETARIMEINRNLPTRPIVKTIASADGKRIEEKIIDLSQVPGISIEKAVDESSLNLKDGRLQLELLARKWWVK